MHRRTRYPFRPLLNIARASLAVSLLTTSCNQKVSIQKVTIQNRGSDTMLSLAQAWAEQYKMVMSNVEVEVSGGGSGVGLAALTQGTIDIFNASRSLNAEELAQVEKHTGKKPQEIVVAYDAVAIYVHKSNPLNEITLDQIAQIYAEGGTITRWSDLGVEIPGGSNDEIVRVSRQSSSGTYEFLRERVFNRKDFKLGSRDMIGSKEVCELVGATPTAIGYSGMGYVTPTVKLLKVKRTPTDPAHEPSVATTLAGTYPLARSLQVYTLGQPQGATKAYLEWILSDAGQKVVEASGYVPLSAAHNQRP